MIIHGNRLHLVAPERPGPLPPEEDPFRLGPGGEAEVRRLVREGLARPLVVDVLAPADAPDRLEVRLAGLHLALEPHRPRLSGAPQDGAFVLGYRTAAWLYGSGPVPEVVDVVIAPQTGRVRRPGLLIHEHRVDPAQVLRLGGLWVTTPERTAADLARQRPEESGHDEVALWETLDRLREHTGVDAASVLHQLEVMPYARGVAKARDRLLRWAVRPRPQGAQSRLPVTR